MTIQNTSNRKVGPIQGNGIAVSFAFTFKVFLASDVLVTYLNASSVELVLTLDTDYTVTLNADQNAAAGGSVVMLWAPAAGTYLSLTSQVTNTQNLVLTNAGGFYPSAINDALDRIVIQVQQLAEQVTRAAKVPVSGIGSLVASSLVFGINSVGLPVLSVLANISQTAVSTFMSTVLGSASSAAAQTALGIPLAFQQDLYSVSNAGGTANAITASFTPTITSTTLSAGVVILSVRAAFANATVAPTFTPNSGTIAPAVIVKGNGLPLIAGDIAGAGHWLTVQWDATLAKWVLLNPAFGVSQIAQSYVPPAQSITKAMMVTGALDRTNLATSVISKVAALPARSPAEIQSHNMMVRMGDGSLLAWGRTVSGQLGLNHADDITSLPRKPTFNVAVPSGVTVVDHAQTSQSSYVLLSNGWVYATGINSVGQLGVGDVAVRNILTRIEYFVSNSISISKMFVCGTSNGTGASAFFLTSAGTAYATGLNNYGQLGIGTTVNNTTPSLISGSITGIVSITMNDAAGMATFLRTSGGQIYSAGYNAAGQLGLGDLVNRTSFTLVSSLSNVANVVATYCSNGTTANGHTLALLTDGTVYATGYNGYGQLGLNTTVNVSAFTKITTLSNIASIGCAGGFYGFSWALSTAGTLYTWGYNAQGACGTGNVTQQLVPYSLAAAGFNGIIAQVETHTSGYAGHQYVVVLDTNNKLWFAGWDYSYFVGDTAAVVMTFAAFRNPTLDSVSETITAIRLHGALTVYRLFVLSSDSKLYCIGDNTNGIAQGGYNPAVPAIVRSLQKIPL